jgi:hypothetical protein
VVIKHFLNQSLSTTLLDGFSIPRMLSLSFIFLFYHAFLTQSGSLGVPYHSWRITHAKHHASTGHMTQDQVFVPKTRSDLGLPPLDAAKEDPVGRSVTDEVKQELWEALGDSPVGATLGFMSYLVRTFSIVAYPGS